MLVEEHPGGTNDIHYITRLQQLEMHKILVI